MTSIERSNHSEDEGSMQSSPNSTSKTWKERYEYLMKIQKEKMQDLYRNNVETAADFFELCAARFARNQCLESVHSESTYTYEEVNMRANAIAHWLENALSEKEGGISSIMVSNSGRDLSNQEVWNIETLKGFPSRPYPERVIGFLMENRPSYIITWLGIAKLGYTVSCYNCFADITWHVYISKAPYVIISEKQKALWTSTVTQLKKNGFPIPHCWIYEVDILPFVDYQMTKYYQSLQTELKSQKVSIYNQDLKNSINSDSLHSPELSINPDLVSFGDKSFSLLQNNKRHQLQRSKLMTREEAVFHIFTSGTTGRSKAACFSNRRFYGAGVTWSSHMNLVSTDKYYIPLPLFHGNGGVVAVAACMISGCSMIIREKFSASNTFPDIRKYNCTAMIYIGELWRYIYNQPEQKDDSNNPLRVIAGNGLRPEIWEAVCHRFNIESIVEHYGQTEMISAHPTINSYGRIGSCGYIPPEIWNNQNEDILIRYDVEKDEVFRNPETGFCERVPVGTPGECISILPNGVYKGYTNDNDNEKKIYRNVFTIGDSYFRSGDLLQVDQDGFFYFVDRAGDTYRWKGENISTIEVSKALAHFPDIQEINIYGVRVPNHEGKAGMACIQMQNGKCFDPEKFFRWVLESKLPHYAYPYFIRIIDRENPKTSTLKFQKYQFSKEGFDPKSVFDDIYFGDFKNRNTYVKLTEELYTKIITHEIRL